MQVHSRVKLVTNSSSETYMFLRKDEEGLNTLKKFIDAVLAAGGSKETADTLFEFELVPQYSYLDEERDYLEAEGREPDSWSMLSTYPKGIHTVKITPRVGVNVSSDLTKLIASVFDVAEIGNDG